MTGTLSQVYDYDCKSIPTLVKLFENLLFYKNFMYYLLETFYLKYVKKEDVREVPNLQRRLLGITLLGSAILIGIIIQLFIVPRIMNLYNDFDLPFPTLTQASPYIAAVMLAIAIYLLSTKPDYSRVDGIANKYKSGEMIKMRELRDTKLVLILFMVFMLVVGYIVLSVILPIYSLTNLQ